jgi:hypothetical protein
MTDTLPNLFQEAGAALYADRCAALDKLIRETPLGLRLVVQETPTKTAWDLASGFEFTAELVYAYVGPDELPTLAAGSSGFTCWPVNDGQPPWPRSV